MPAILPSTALKNEQRAIEAIADKEIVYITENGRGKYLFMSQEVHDREIAEAVGEALYEARMAEALKARVLTTRLGATMPRVRTSGLPSSASMLPMPRLEYSGHFAEDLAHVTSSKVEARVYSALDNVEAFGEFGLRVVLDSIRRDFGEGVRKVVAGPFDLVYTHYPDEDLVRVEELVHQRAVR